MRIENRQKIIVACHRYVKTIQPSILPDFIQVIDDENINTKVLEKLELYFNMLYELQKDYWVEDDEKVIRKTGIVARQIVDILENNKN